MTISKFQKLFGVGPAGALIGVLIFCILGLLDRALHHIQIFSRPAPIRAAGLILVLIWICWHAWCLRTISQWWRHDRLCTTGPYRFVRHPIYSGATLLAVAGISLMCNSWIILLWPLFLFSVYSLLVRKEEAMMASIFGEEYRRYAAQTARLFPRLFR